MMLYSVVKVRPRSSGFVTTKVVTSISLAGKWTFEIALAAHVYVIPQRTFQPYIPFAMDCSSEIAVSRRTLASEFSRGFPFSR